MNSYELSRNWFDYSFANPEKVKPIHSSIFFFAIEHCNRLGWKEKFGFPSQMVMEAIGVKNWRTYSKALNELVEFGFIKMIETSKNQYSSNIIAIVNNTKADTKALDKALQKHGAKQGQSTVSIDKQYNNITIKLLNKHAGLVIDNLKTWIDSADYKEIKQEDIDFIYLLYPSSCPTKNSSTGKGLKDKEKISDLLKSISVQDLKTIIDRYVMECTRDQVYIKNFKTFLSNPPDYGSHSNGSKYLPKIEKLIAHVALHNPMERDRLLNKGYTMEDIKKYAK